MTATRITAHENGPDRPMATQAVNTVYEIRQLTKGRPHLLNGITGVASIRRRKRNGFARLSVDDLIAVLRSAHRDGERKSRYGAQHACFILNAVVLDAGLHKEVVAIPRQDAPAERLKEPELEQLDVAVEFSKFNVLIEEAKADGRVTPQELQAIQTQAVRMQRETLEALESLKQKLAAAEAEIRR